TPGAVAGWDAETGLEAARRAVRGRTAPAPAPWPVRGAHVVDLFPPPHPALNWGGEDLLTEVLAIDPTATGTALTEAPADPAGFVAGILRRAEGSALVVAVHDAELYPWQAELRDALLAGRPDAVRVSTGLPEAGDADGVLSSYGRGRVNLRAVAEVLVGG
ncbi:sugar hydrolase, partial [Streptomyces montanus]